MLSDKRQGYQPPRQSCLCQPRAAGRSDEHRRAPHGLGDRRDDCGARRHAGDLGKVESGPGDRGPTRLPAGRMEAGGGGIARRGKNRARNRGQSGGPSLVRAYAGPPRARRRGRCDLQQASGPLDPGTRGSVSPGCDECSRRQSGQSVRPVGAGPDGGIRTSRIAGSPRAPLLRHETDRSRGRDGPETSPAARLGGGVVLSCLPPSRRSSTTRPESSLPAGRLSIATRMPGAHPLPG